MLAPGDPGRALRLAQALTEKPVMLNHARGLWGYTGTAADGLALTIQSTGLGGPSAAAVVGDLAALGAQRIVRVGTCTALDEALGLGALLAAGPVTAPDGEELLPPLAAGLPAIALASTDLDDTPVLAGARARDLTSGGFLAAARAHGMEAGVVVLVARDARGATLDDDALHEAELALGGAALRALA